MGSCLSCSVHAAAGRALLLASAGGDLVAASEILRDYPKASCYVNYRDRTSPLIQAASRGNFELLQLVLETAVMSEGIERAKKLCIDHVNQKQQSALIVACKHGHSDCVEYLVNNGADPMLADERRHNTALHFAALYGHSDCIHKLLSSRISHSPPQGPQVTMAVSHILCSDEGNIRFIDRHNGWGLSALHIAVFQGSVNSVRTLLRNGASLDSIIIPAKIENSPIRCAVGSNSLHIAALIGNIAMAKVILESQEAVAGLELRSMTDAASLRPQEYAQRARSPVLVHLLDERLPVPLLRQIWVNYSIETSMPPRHQTLASMLLKMKLMFNLEVIALQKNISTLSESIEEGTKAAAKVEDSQLLTPNPRNPASSVNQDIRQRQTLYRRMDEIKVLQSSSTQLHATLKALCDPSKRPVNNEMPSGSQEAILDFILSTLISPRTVSSILHASKKLVCANVISLSPSAASVGGLPPVKPAPPEIEVQHGMALVSTALRAIETCLAAAAYLANPVNVAAAVAAGAAPQAATGAAPPSTSSLASNAVLSDARATNAAASSMTPASSFTLSVPSPSLMSSVATLTGLNNNRQSPTEGGATEAAAAAAPPLTPFMDSVLASTAVTAGSAATANISSPPLLNIPLPPSSLPTGTGPIGGTAFPPPVTHTGVLGPNGQPVMIDGPTQMLVPNWSSHLHALVAQLHWDIGIQRHRRRRQHAAARAMQETASLAMGASTGAQMTTPDGVPLGQALSQTPPASLPAQPSSPPPRIREASSRGAFDELEAAMQLMTSPSSPPVAAASTTTAVDSSDRPPSSGAQAAQPRPAREASSSTAVAASVTRELQEDPLVAEDEGDEDAFDEGEALAGDAAGSEVWSEEDGDGLDDGLCSICMDQPVAVLITGCHHGLCVHCAFQLTIKGREMPSCPFCRQKIPAFEAKMPDPLSAQQSRKSLGGDKTPKAKSGRTRKSSNGATKASNNK